jgi:asparagine synthase (glutamine-hydrolysing)
MIEDGESMNFICNSLDGDFAFVAMKGDEIYAARDVMGVRPLFYGVSNGLIHFCSEIKGLQDVCVEIKEFPKGCYYNSIEDEFYSYHDVSVPNDKQISYDPNTLQAIIEASIEKRLMTDRPIGFFLSGGLDSSIIAAVAAKKLGKIKTFSIGIGDSPDLKAAKMVADYINSDHTEMKFTFMEGLSAIKDVIWALESYDCTTIRASVPMFLLSKYVSEHTDIKVILSGEGADELFGGYLYFHNAPNPEEFQKETLRLLDNVHAHDILRADRCTAHHGLELRVPFFDKTLINYVKSIDPKFKISQGIIEKKILRQAFTNVLPKQIVWRQKNGMSDAVGYSWVDSIRQYVNDNIEYEKPIQYLKNPPLSKEELYYRNIYKSLFKPDLLPHVWRPKWTDEKDPSAKLLNVFNS